MTSGAARKRAASKDSEAQRRGMAATREYGKNRKFMDVSLSAQPVKKGSLSKKAEAQRRGMAATRAKAQKKRLTPAQAKAVRDRDKQRRQDEMYKETQRRFEY